MEQPVRISCCDGALIAGEGKFLAGIEVNHRRMTNGAGLAGFTQESPSRWRRRGHRRLHDFDRLDAVSICLNFPPRLSLGQIVDFKGGEQSR
jgi:hypothetical protein